MKYRIANGDDYQNCKDQLTIAQQECARLLEENRMLNAAIKEINQQLDNMRDLCTARTAELDKVTDRLARIQMIANKT